VEYRLKVGDLERGADGLAPGSLDRVTRTFDEAGLVLLEGAFSPAFVDRLAQAFHAQHGRMTAEGVAAAAREPGSPWLLVGEDRYEVVVRMEGAFRDTNLFASRLLMPVLSRLLGDGFQLSVFSIVLAQPGAAEQHTHRDHDSLFPKDAVLSSGLPPYAVNVAVPLVDIDRLRGPTAFWLGSHRWEGVDETLNADPIVPELARGDCLLVDYRTLHRGTANASSVRRPILYMAYARPWFFDQINHKRRAPVDMPLGEGEPVPGGLSELLTRPLVENEKMRARALAPSVLPSSELEGAMAKSVQSLTAAGGEILLPALPGKVGELAQRVLATAAVAGRPFGESDAATFRQALAAHMVEQFGQSPHAWVHVKYGSDADDPTVLHWTVAPVVLPEEAAYADDGEGKGPPLLGDVPDARLVQLAGTLGAPKEVTFLDVGAARGRNAVALARLGYPTVAVEPISEIAEALERRVAEERLAVEVVRGDFWDPGVSLPRSSYRLVSVTEPGTRLRGLTSVRALLRRLSQVLEPSGMALLHVFLARGDYVPDPATRELAEAMSSPVYTREELEDAAFGLPLELASDEDALAYEREHRASWPPAPWYEAWASGRHVFDLEAAACPIELRWLVYRRR
jgi:ectoine hydroxylase-related dioxygenase (phytanoyl-CoA dioxygenase family)